MKTYIRFKDNKQVEATVLESRPEGKEWYEAPEYFSWKKNYKITQGGEIIEQSVEDIQKDLLDNAKLCALDSIRCYFDNFTNRYAGHSHQKAKSYEIQAKAAENILALEPNKLNEKDTQIIEPLAKVRGITVIEMAKLIQNKAQQAVKAIIKCEELEDLAKEKIKEIKSKEELQEFINRLKQEMEKR
jgi:hypothetical protein